MNKFRMISSRWNWLSMALVVCLVDAQGARAAIESYILDGIAAPDGNGQVASFRPPVLNDEGQLAIIASLTGTTGGSQSSDRHVLLRRETNGSLVQIARGGQSGPEGGGVFTSFGETPWLGGNGDVAFFQSGNLTGIFRGPPLVQIVRTGSTQAPPGGNGAFSIVRIGGMNDEGQVSFFGFLSGTTPTTANRAVYRGDGASLVEIARAGSPVPGGTGTFASVNELTKINHLGEVAFSGVINVPHVLQGVFRGDGTATASIALTGQPAPAMGGGTSGTYTGFTGFGGFSGSAVSINDAGQVAYSAQIAGTPSGYTSGLFRGDGVASAMIVRSSLAAPNGSGGATGTFANWDRPVINAGGAVAFWAQLQGTPGGSADNEGLFIGDGTTLRQVVREGDLAPDGNGRLQFFSRNTLFNDLGQTAFYASHSMPAPGTNGAIYLHDPIDGLRTIARVGQPLLGSTIQSLMLAGTNLDIPINDQQTDGLNNQGQVAFQFRLATGEEGVAIWSPPDADFNKDGAVDGDDLGAWGDDYGDDAVANPLLQADANGDDFVDGADFLIWQREVTASGGAPANLLVPEPGAATLGLATALAFSLRRRRRA